jgi:hypothetical protein
MEQIKCCKCKLLKDVSMFGKNKKTSTGYKYRCRGCETQAQRERREKQKLENPEKVKAKNDAYYKKHKDSMKVKQKIYMSKPDVRKNRNEYIRKYKAEKRKNDKSYVIYENLRKRIWKSLKNKSNSSKELLGCEIDLYFKWIEFTMTEDMNWENYGTFWNIDHLIPLNKFELNNPEEAMKAFNWKNTWAMKSNENFIKKSNIIQEQLPKHNELLNKFTILYNIESVISSQADEKSPEGSETR